MTSCKSIQGILVSDHVEDTRKNAPVEFCLDNGFLIQDHLESHEHTHVIR